MIPRVVISGLLALAPLNAQAFSLEFPSRTAAVAETSQAIASYFLPTAPFIDGPIAGVTVEGMVRQQSWKMDNAGLTTLQILAPLRSQLEQAGYAPIYECEARVCGGFDFRYQMEILPEPDMHVNLGDYRYLAAERDNDGTSEYVALIVSRSANAGFVQLTRIEEPEATRSISGSTKVPMVTSELDDTGPVGLLLETAGHATLDDLNFKTGSSELDDEKFASLVGLADYLAERPDRRIVLVGHTDAEGTLDANIVLSRRRAASVMERLIVAYGVSAVQVSADGVGFLAPRASNLTQEGRSLNRRVEVILSSTE